ncbi:MAG: hypothetical protein ACE15D_02055 [Candidatus Eisenbacteria bacterium]|nr:hypothetical protein [Candidatus Eisenbacteria bacterium]
MKRVDTPSLPLARRRAGCARGMLLLVAGTALLAGCSLPASRVARDPFRYQARDVTVRGEVVWSGWLPEVGSRGFLLADDGESLLVLTPREAPPRGKRTRVAGTVEAAFDLGDRTAAVLLENGAGRRERGKLPDFF